MSLGEAGTPDAHGQSETAAKRPSVSVVTVLPGVEPGARIPTLDGLRGLAVIAVMLFHFKSRPWIPGGFLAVDLFFVLSGFLITALLVRERAISGRVRLGAFYLRRSLRLLPAYVAVWAVYLLGTSLLPASITGDPPFETSLLNLIFCLTYVFNWTMAWSKSSPPDIAHFWSLGVEEQYYLIWPCVLAVTFRLYGTGRGAFRACTVLAVVSCLVPCALEQLIGADWRRLYYATDARAHGLLLGGLFGFLHARRELSTGWMSRGLSKVLLSVVAIVIVGLTLSVKPGSTKFLTHVLPFVSLGLAMLVAAAATLSAGSLHCVLTHRVFVYLGRRSYALYLWHLPLAHWFRSLDAVSQLVFGIGTSIVCAEASWRLVEVPGLKLGRALFAASRRHPVSPLGE